MGSPNNHRSHLMVMVLKRLTLVRCRTWITSASITRISQDSCQGQGHRYSDMCPMFDYQCPSCGFTGESFVHKADTPVECSCGTPMTRLLTACNIIQDTVPGGFIIENLDKVPRRFESKSQYRDELAARGLRLTDRHVGSQGSDKNPHTTKWE